ncbi:S8 family peptidase [Xanthomonas hortorum]|uniref:S8 family peptidase n=1 Tax=Xanthomonas hortorum TaxID=56454 RepID=UPI0015935208|nr:S8 family peptidase [Xanthomonas hortorum]NHF65284.1 S8 family peptidase [Xanthomonas hortorum]
MAEQPKFLLGQGETLTSPSEFRSGPSDAQAPYSIQVQRTHLRPMFEAQAEGFQALPEAACPGGNVVSMVTLHPSYYSRSNFPDELLREAGLRFVGSMPTFVKPRNGRGHDLAGGAASTVLFVAGTKQSFQHLARRVQTLQEDDPIAADILKIEAIHPQTRQERIQADLAKNESNLEVVVHYDPLQDYVWEEQFGQYAQACGLKLGKKTYQSRGLWFISARGTSAAAKRLADFSFVRAIRPMPVLRPVDAPKLMRAAKPISRIILPFEGPLDPNCRVAVFDGGLPANHPFGQWASRFEPSPGDGIGDATSDGLGHGLGVTSALLFGHMKPGLQPRPYCHVDHYRVLGADTDAGMYNAMLYVDKILGASAYEFVSLSIGPEEITGHDKVSAWTTMLDDHFHQASMLGTIAVGNDGDLPPPRNRVQVPGDCVNAIAVGASDSHHEGGKRAPYSSIGPGRSPSLVKPDLVHFGGVDDDQFSFLFPGGVLAQSTGTSFSAPSVMRIATGVRAHFGRSFTPLAVRALIIHSAERGQHPRDEVGWGLAPSDVADIAVCPDNSVRILYQGTLAPSKVSRVAIPIPPGGLAGKVTIRATFCYLSETDAHAPGDYTRAGLGVTFRPHSGKFPTAPKKGPPNWKPHPDFPKSDSFFEGVGRKTEQAMRTDAFKWDTVRDATISKYGSSLKDPIFDVHYMARQPGRKTAPTRLPPLRYALVVTVTAPKHPSIYDDVLAAYTTLKPLLPLAELPLQIGDV